MPKANQAIISNHRAINQGGNSHVGQRRHHLYTCCLEKINSSMASKFYLEAITILESMLADRLESRLAFINQQTEASREFRTLGNLIKDLRSAEDKENLTALEVYEEIKIWSKERNHYIHEMVKISEESLETWNQRYSGAKRTAELGEFLFRKLDKEVRKLNQYKNNQTERN